MARLTDARLTDKVALITGGARGMGAETARLLAANGATVVVADILVDDGKATAQSIVGATYRTLDVSSQQGWSQVVADTLDKHGRIDVLVNNAGIDLIKRLSDTTLEEFERLISVNQLGTFLGMQTVANAMIEAGGPCSIVNISSVAGLEGVKNHAAYSATKFAVTGLTKAAAKEWGRYGIRVNSVHPGIIETPMTDGLFVDPNVRQRVERNLPLKRLGQPADIANMVLFLASDQSSYCTGQAFTVDGGVHP